MSDVGGGGEPGTLYVMQVGEADVVAGIDDGQVAWPGTVVAVARERAEVEAAAVEDLRSGAAYRGSG